MNLKVSNERRVENSSYRQVKAAIITVMALYHHTDRETHVEHIKTNAGDTQ